MTKAAKGRWKFMMNNMDNNIAEEQKETKSLAEIMESFGKAFLKLWWIAVILMVVAGLGSPKKKKLTPWKCESTPSAKNILQSLLILE